MKLEVGKIYRLTKIYDPYAKLALFNTFFNVHCSIKENSIVLVIDARAVPFKKMPSKTNRFIKVLYNDKIGYINLDRIKEAIEL